MLDAMTVLRDYLLTQAALTALVGTRIIRESAVPAQGWKPSDGACVCLSSRGGAFDGSDAMQVMPVQITAWGRDVQEAQQIYRLVVDVLDDAHNGDLRHAYLEALGQTVRQADTGWPYVMSGFRIKVRREE